MAKAVSDQSFETLKQLVKGFFGNPAAGMSQKPVKGSLRRYLEGLQQKRISLSSGKSALDELFGGSFIVQRGQGPDLVVTAYPNLSTDQVQELANLLRSCVAQLEIDLLSAKDEFPDQLG